MPHVYVIVSRIYGRLFLYLMKQQIGRHLHKDSSLDEKTMPRVYVIVSRIWAHWEKSIENKISKRYCRVVQTYCLGRAPTNFHVAECHLSNNHLFLPHMLLCGLGVYTWAATTLDEIAVYTANSEKVVALWVPKRTRPKYLVVWARKPYDNLF